MLPFESFAFDGPVVRSTDLLSMSALNSVLLPVLFGAAPTISTLLTMGPVSCISSGTVVLGLAADCTYPTTRNEILGYR